VDQYRACVHALESRLAKQALTGEVWAECVELARLELSDLQTALLHKSKLLEKEGDALFGILCEIAGVVDAPAAAGLAAEVGGDAQLQPVQIPPKQHARATERALERLWEDRELVSELMLAAAAKAGSSSNKSQSASSPQVYLYVPPDGAAENSSCSQDGGDGGSRSLPPRAPMCSSHVVSGDADAGEEDMYFLLEKVRNAARALQLGSRKGCEHSADFGSGEIATAFGRWITSLAERQPGAQSSSAAEAGEAQAQLLQAVPLSDSFCCTMLRHISGLDKAEEARVHEKSQARVEKESAASESQGQGGDGEKGLVGGRSVRKRKPSSLAAEAGLEIAGIGAAAGVEVEEQEDPVAVSDSAVISTGATVLRRTPRGVPLVLSDSGAMEDGFVGVFTGLERDARVDVLAELGALPQFLLEDEKRHRRGTHLRGALRRAQRCLAAIEKEKVEWESQVGVWVGVWVGHLPSRY
jgi:hypothetical protein